MKHYRLFKLIIITSLFSILSACQSVNGAVGGYFGLYTDLEITFEVDADINPDELGKASPMYIRMYELKSKKMMKKSDFIEIYERDKEVLGADMLAVHKLKYFKPGESRIEHFVLSPKTHYVALYGEFLEFKNSEYKLIIPVVANNVFRNSVVIRVSGNKLIFDEEIDEEVDDGSDLREKTDKTKDSADKAQDTADKTKKSADKIKKLF